MRIIKGRYAKENGTWVLYYSSLSTSSLFDFSILVTGILERVQVYETFIKGRRTDLYGAENHADADRTHGGGGGCCGLPALLEFLSGASRTVGRMRIGFPGELGAAFCVKMFSSSDSDPGF